MEKIETIRDVYSIHIYKGEVEKILGVFEEREGRMQGRKKCIEEGEKKVLAEKEGIDIKVDVKKILAEKEGIYRRKGIECIQEGRYMY